MHLAIHSSPLAESSAARLLGSDHPLVRELDRRAALHVELLVLAVLLAGGSIGVTTGAETALPIAIAAGTVAAVTGFRLMLCGAQIRSLALALLAEGRERLPLAEVQKERARLLGVRRRRREARWLRDLADGRDVGGGFPGRVPPIISPRVTAHVRDDLLEVSAALTAEAPRVAGLALLEQLECEPWSPLFGDDPRALREALCRVRFLLAS